MVDAPQAPAPEVPAAPAAPAPAAAPAAKVEAPAPAAAAPEPVKQDDKASLLEAIAAKSPAGETNAQPKPGDPPAPAAGEPVVFDLALPEGFKVTDEVQFKDFSKLLSEKTGSKENAQELFNYIAAEKTKLETAALDNQRSVWETTNKQWKEQVAADPVVGGANLQTNLGQISSVIDQFGKDIPTLRQTLTMTGAGNHPDIVRFLHNVSQALKEGGPIMAAKAAPKPKSTANALYAKTGA